MHESRDSNNWKSETLERKTKEMAWKYGIHRMSLRFFIMTGRSKKDSHYCVFLKQCKALFTRCLWMMVTDFCSSLQLF